MNLEIALEADEEWDSSRSWEPLVRKAAEAAIAESAFPQLGEANRPVELSVRLAGDEEVRALNAHWRGKDKPTNGVCEREAAEKGVGMNEHATHLVVHGTLHLLGYDHVAEADAAEMESREVRALARLGIANPYEVTA
jgi:probable rRNA maturation factor